MNLLKVLIKVLTKIWALIVKPITLIIDFQYSTQQFLYTTKDFMAAIFVIIDGIYNEYIPENIKNCLHKDLAILSDSKIITISIVDELLSIDSEKTWISYVSKNLKDFLPKM